MYPSNDLKNSSECSKSRPIDQELCRLHHKVIICEEDDETDSALNGFNVTSYNSSKNDLSGSWASMNSIDSHFSAGTAISNLSPTSPSTLPNHLHHQNALHRIHPFTIGESQQAMPPLPLSPGTWNMNHNQSRLGVAPGHSFLPPFIHNNTQHHTFSLPQTTQEAPADPRFTNHTPEMSTSLSN